MLRSIWRGALGGLVSLTVAGAALAQANVNQTPSNYKAPSGAYAFGGAVNLFGLESVTGAECIVGLTATCQLPTPSGGGGGGGTGGAGTDASGTVTVGGTYQTVFAQNSSRKACAIQNTSGAPETVRQGSATLWTIQSYGWFYCAAGGGPNWTTDLIEITSATMGATFSANSQ